jgi:peroxiredoxin
MVQVTVGSKPFYIDTFEASVDAEGRALSLFGAVPANASWYSASAACEAAGKRICTSEEWVTACQGSRAVDDDGNGQFADDYVEGNQFPYADYYEGGWCHDRGKSPNEGGRAGKTGARGRCRTPSGIYDLAGNLSEWAGPDEDSARLLGGHFYAKEKAACFRPVQTFGPGHKNLTMGFRCCADSLVVNPTTEAVDAVAPVGFEDKPLPQFEATLLDGTVVDSSTLRGKVTYLSFFASWCGPCKAEFEGLNRMTKHYAGKDFQILAIGVDTDEAKSRRAAKVWGAEFPVAADPHNKILGLFDVTSMPTTYIIDKQGIIRKKHVGWTNKDEKTWKQVTPVIDGLL